MLIPTKITPCPIVDATIGIFFETDMVPDAIFGIVYNAFKDEYPEVERLPILQVPAEIRSKDKNLIRQPHYRIKNKKFVLVIGPKGVSLGINGAYVGWQRFLPEVDKVFKKTGELGIIKNVKRLGIRYINVFDFDIYEKINLKVSLEQGNLKHKNLFIKTDVVSDSFISTLQVANNATGTILNKRFSGSIIDIDTHIEKEIGAFFSNYTNLLIEGHEEEKKIFFSLLSPEYLKTLNPEYMEEQ